MRLSLGNIAKFIAFVTIALALNTTLFSQKLPKNMYFNPDSTRLITGGVKSNNLYDQKKIESIYLEFPLPGFWDTLISNHDKGTDLKATLKMNGKVYEGVGVRFKGMSSYMMTGDSKKKSFNISIDYTDDKQRLMGYKTLNLNNAAEDPSFMREILYQDLIGKYIPTTKGNFVKLYVNNEYFGLYSNIQQIDNVFIKEWFLSSDGSRWRAYVKSGFPMGQGGPGGPGAPMGVPGGPMGGPGRPGGPQDNAMRARIDSLMKSNGITFEGGRMNEKTFAKMDSLMRTIGIEMPHGGPGGPGRPGGPGGKEGPDEDSDDGPGGGMWGQGLAGLNYLGEDTTEYQKNYTLKSSKLDNPWEDLIKVTYILNKTPLAHLEDSLSNYLDIDRTLWMLACENIFLDDDGYVFKGGMDYYLYFEPETQRMVTLQYDGNATFSSFNSNWSPFINEKNENYPLLNRVLKVPSLRQRYLAHVRIIIQESLNPSVIDPIIDQYAALIGVTVQEDPIKLSTKQEFDEEIPVLKNFSIKRKTYLLSNAEVNQKGVFIGKITVKAKTTGNPVLTPNEPAVISVVQNKSDQIKQINLWYSTGLVGKFSKIGMSDQGKNGDDISGDGIYKAVLPGFQDGTLVRYYLEAISSDKFGTATYAPAGAEHDVFVYKVR